MKDGKVELLKVLLGMAFVDGEFSHNEERLVEFLIDSYHLTPEQEREVRSQKDADVDLEKLAESITKDDERKQAYESAMLVALMDGGQEPEESELLDRLRDALNIDDTTREETEERAHKIYERFVHKDDPEEEE